MTYASPFLDDELDRCDTDWAALGRSTGHIYHDGPGSRPLLRPQARDEWMAAKNDDNGLLMCIVYGEADIYGATRAALSMVVAHRKVKAQLCLVLLEDKSAKKAVTLCRKAGYANPAGRVSVLVNAAHSDAWEREDREAVSTNAAHLPMLKQRDEQHADMCF